MNRRKYLLVVEGEKAEVSVFTKVLNRHGFKVDNSLPKVDFSSTSQGLGIEMLTIPFITR